MTTVFRALALNSLRGGVLILAVLLLRLVLRRTPGRVFCFLWGLVAIRLLLPVRLTAFFGLLPGRQAADSESVLSGNVKAFAMLSTEQGTPPAPAVESPVLRLAGLLPWVWLTVAAGLLLWTFLRWLRFRRSLCSAEQLENGVWRSDRVRTPFAVGILRPRIYVPAKLEPDCFPWVLAHEQAHLKHGDTCRKALAYALLIVYWFQPLCWLGWYAFCRDLELACDERVTDRLPLSERKAYALALLRCSAPAGIFGATAFGEKPVSVRIRAVLRNRRQPRWLSAAIGVFCVLLLLALSFETAASAQTPEQPLPEPAVPAAEPAEAHANNVIKLSASDADSACSAYVYVEDGTVREQIMDNADRIRLFAAPETVWNFNPDDETWKAEHLSAEFSGPLWEEEGLGTYRVLVYSDDESTSFRVQTAYDDAGLCTITVLETAGTGQGKSSYVFAKDELGKGCRACGSSGADSGRVCVEIQTTRTH